MKWEGVNDNACYIATIKNYSADNALDIELTINVTFQENVLDVGSNHSGSVIGTHPFKIHIGALKANAEDSYEFYILKLSPYWVSFYPDKYAVIKKLGSEKDKKILMSVINGHPIKFPFSLPPANFKEINLSEQNE